MRSCGLLASYVLIVGGEVMAKEKREVEAEEHAKRLAAVLRRKKPKE